MGVGYQASALNKIHYLAASSDDALERLVAPNPIFEELHVEAVQLHRPAVGDIVRWRDDLAERRRDQIGEILTWDEASDFVVCDDAAPSGDVLLRYVAAVINEKGPDVLPQFLGNTRPSYDEQDRVFEVLERQAGACRFPQLLFVSTIWLPFHRDTIIDDVDWEGREQRFGSTFRLAAELAALRALIATADPDALEWTSDRETPTNMLWAAWQASDTILLMCLLANAHGLPLWTTG